MAALQRYPRGERVVVTVVPNRLVEGCWVAEVEDTAEGSLGTGAVSGGDVGTTALG